MTLGWRILEAITILIGVVLVGSVVILLWERKADDE